MLLPQDLSTTRNSVSAEQSASGRKPFQSICASCMHSLLCSSGAGGPRGTGSVGRAEVRAEVTVWGAWDTSTCERWASKTTDFGTRCPSSRHGSCQLCDPHFAFFVWNIGSAMLTRSGVVERLNQAWNIVSVLLAAIVIVIR